MVLSSQKILGLCRESCSDPQLTAELMEYCVSHHGSHLVHVRSSALICDMQLRQVLSVDADQKEVEELCCLATSRFSGESSLWKLRLSANCCSHDDGVFHDAIKMVPVSLDCYCIGCCDVGTHNLVCDSGLRGCLEVLD